MKTKIATLALMLAIAMALPARGQNEASALSTLSALPIVSVAGVASVGASAVVAIPVVLSTAGAVLVVKSVEVSVRGTVYVLERASDGARVSVEVAGRGAANAILSTGMLVTVSVIGAGTILSVAGEAIAFLPNALGRALLHNERLPS